MSETITIKDGIDDPVASCVWASMVELLGTKYGGHGYGRDDIIKTFNLQPNATFPLQLTIELKVNGVEVPFAHYMKFLNKHLDEYIANKARDLIKDACNDVVNCVHELEHLAMSKLPKNE